MLVPPRPSGTRRAASPLVLVVLTVALFAATLLWPEPARASHGPNTVAYRINVGGPLIDTIVPWAKDTEATPSQFVNATATGNQTYTTTHAIDVTDTSIPAGTPLSMFKDHRYSAGSASVQKLKWNVPVDPGIQYEVRLYFAEITSDRQYMAPARSMS